MYKEEASDFRQTKDRRKVDTAPEKDVKSPFLSSAVDCSIKKTSLPLVKDANDESTETVNYSQALLPPCVYPLYIPQVIKGQD